MKLPLTKEEYSLLQKSAEGHGLTVDQEAQLAILYFFKAHDTALLAGAKRAVDSEVLQVFEKS